MGNIASWIDKSSPLFILLIDPDTPLDIAQRTVEAGCSNGVDIILIGGSFISLADFDNFVKEIKKVSTVPVILFPGGSGQVSGNADAILFMSLISGRNPTWLIEEQVKSAPLIKKIQLETIPTGYMLIGSAIESAVCYVSNTRPIPFDQSGIIVAHGLAGKFLGMRLLYLDAGSGAKTPIYPEIISKLHKEVGLPIFVGGGIRTPEMAHKLMKAGAKGVVVGNLFEDFQKIDLIKNFADVIHNH